VVAPIGVGAEGETYNINADTVAGAIAGALKASKLVMLTDVSGVLDKQKTLISELTPKIAHELMRDGTISGGMIPKVETCLAAVAGGAGAAHILDGRVPHVLLLEVFTEAGVGTKLWEH
jgi:acetylglutamate kinase